MYQVGALLAIPQYYVLADNSLAELRDNFKWLFSPGPHLGHSEPSSQC